MHNFVTRDGATPDEFRRVAREQLRQYPNVVVLDVAVGGVTGAKGGFHVAAGANTVEARRILLCTGMVDELLPIDGFRELWGRAIVQCPYCHGWEAKDRPWGYLVRAVHAQNLQMFALQLRGWTNDVCVFTNGEFEIPAATQHQLVAAASASRRPGSGDSSRARVTSRRSNSPTVHALTASCSSLTRPSIRSMWFVRSPSGSTATGTCKSIR
jgi:thioredoxin reductase